MPGLRKSRSRLALLGAFAMAASVLAVGASPVSAVPGKADAAAGYSACVGPAAADAGFTDVAAGSTHDAAINCIAYYGITRGSSATTFSPGQTISRWQLAVMLQRASGPAGVDLPAARDMGFTDISDLGSSFQAAVNQMAALGVMAGTTATTFDPSGIVSRTTIVEALAGFLTSARVGPGGKALSRGVDRSLTIKDSTAANAATVTPDETFRDLGGVTFSAFEAIRALSEMGVVQGRSDGTFGPTASVTRGQAASFITRALAHTNARPAGLTMQASRASVTSAQDFRLAVSVRGNDFSVMESASVDVFSYAAKNAASAFKTDGTCNTGSSGVTTVSGGTAACTIEIDDDVTEPDGNAVIDADQISADRVYWAWTGAAGDTLDWDASSVSMDNSLVSNAASVSVSTVTVPTSAKVTTSVSADAKDKNTVRYGTTVTVTIQLMAGTQPIGVAGQSYTWFATGVHSPTGAARIIPGTGTKTVTTDATGRASFTITQADPDTNAAADGPNEDPDANDSTTWTYNIRSEGTAAAPVANTDIGFTVSAGGNGQGSVVFDDDPSEAEAVKVELQRTWSLRPAAGVTGRVGVTGKVTDQYGDALRGTTVFFDLDGNGNFGCADGTGCGDASDTPSTSIADGKIAGTVPRVTRTNGTNTISATLVSTVTDRWAVYRYQVAADLNGDGDVADDDEIATSQFIWAYHPTGWDPETGMISSTEGDNFTWRRIFGFDPANNTLLKVSRFPGNSWTPIKAHAITYKDTDFFEWYVRTAGDLEAADSQGSRWLTVDAFEARLAKFLEMGESVVRSGDRQVRLQMRVRQFNAKTGISVFEIGLDPGNDIGDPPASP